MVVLFVRLTAPISLRSARREARRKEALWLYLLNISVKLRPGASPAGTEAIREPIIQCSIIVRGIPGRKLRKIFLRSAFFGTAMPTGKPEGKVGNKRQLLPATCAV